MTEPITWSAPTGLTTTSSTVVERPDQMGKDTFLKLLVAQMKYQDPSNPASSSELMSQTAVFSQVEQLETIAGQNTSMLALQRAMSAGSLVGQNVAYTDSTGATQTGTVSAVTIATDSSSSMATVNGQAVDVSRITKVSVPSTGTSTGGTAAGGTPTS